MCGKGTLLAEAALWWPEAEYRGFDADESQLRACQLNYKYMSVQVKSELANSSLLGGLPLLDASVDKLMTAPPWDRQFAAAGGLEELYPRLLREFRRVLRPNGTMVLLASDASLPPLQAALLDDNNSNDSNNNNNNNNNNNDSNNNDKLLDDGKLWFIEAQRRFALTDETVGVLVVARRRSYAEQPERVAPPGPLWWEDESSSMGLRTVRRSWTQVRAKMLPKLQPYFLGNQAVTPEADKEKTKRATNL
ncbi:unnamed protein product [Polarella glacialis]|uniref:Ribosomal RNA large subunit methyltransferase K/L-like methyltransferase domain-containing protein n=1 Tax=Polarella glacialis TaxID=89957 RepID=A0A813K061_POLGL|nr:unnamed protein product [Polarella glacialis]